MGTFGFDVFVGDVFGLEPFDEGLVGFEKTVAFAAGDPEELELCVVFFAEVGEGFFGFAEEHGSAAHGSDPGEFVCVAEADVKGLRSSHGEASDGTLVWLGAELVLFLYCGEHFGHEGLLKTLGVFLEVAAGGYRAELEVLDGHAVAEWHDGDEGLFAGCDELVEDEVGFSDGGPAIGEVAVAVEENEERVALAGLVAGRSVDEEVAILVGHLGVVEVVVDGAVWDVCEFPGLGFIAGDKDHVGWVECVGLHVSVDGVNRADAVDLEGIAVEVGFESRGGGGPNAFVVFGEWEALAAFDGDFDLLCVGGTELEGYGFVGVDGGGEDLLALGLGVQDQGGEEEELDGLGHGDHDIESL